MTDDAFLFEISIKFLSLTFLQIKNLKLKKQIVWEIFYIPLQ